MNLVPLFDPYSRPMSGVATYPSKRALGPGWWASALNIRADDMNMRVRKGYRVIYNPGSGMTARGAASAYGKVYVALDSGSSTEMYEVDLTNASASKPSPSVAFATGKDIGVVPAKQYMRDGNTQKMLFLSAEGEDYCTINPHDVVYPIAIPDVMRRMWRWPRIDEKTIRVVADTPNYIRLNNATATITSSGGGLSGSHGAIGDPISITATTPTRGDWVKIDFGAGTSAYSNGSGALGLHTSAGASLTSETLMMLVDDSSASFIRQAKVELSSDNTTWYTIWDPAPTSGVPLVDETYKDSAEITGRVWGFDISKISGANRKFRYIRITWASDINSYSETVDIHAIVGGGVVEGESTWGIAYAGTNSYFEGQVSIQSTSIDTSIISDVGGSKDWGDRKIPNLAQLKYAYRISIPNPTLLNSSEGSNAAVYALCYRIPAGEERGHYFWAETLYGPSGWFYGSGPGDTATFTINDTSKEDWSVLPREGTGIADSDYLSHIAIFSGSRLIAANNERTGLYVSEHARPNRFSGVVDFIAETPLPWSATYVLFGDDRIVSLAKVANTLIGSDVLVVLTDKALYTMETSDATNASRPRLAQRHGCLATYGVATFADSIAYVDSERQIRIVNQYGETTPSRLVVEDQLINCPDISKVVAGYFNDAFYFFYSVAGETENRNALIWDLRFSKWFMYQYPPGFDVVRLLNHTDPDGNPMFIAILSDGKVVELETGTTDDGSNISIDIQTPDLHGAPWEVISAGRIGLLVDGVGVTLQTTREVISGTNSIASGQIVIPSSSEPQWVMDEASGHTSIPGAAGSSVRFRITGSVPGDTRIYGIFAEIEETKRVGASGG